MNPAQAFDQLVADFGPQGVVAAKMFGKLSLKYQSKAIACLVDDAAAFKLGAGTQEHADALELPGAHLFDPSGMNRPMKDWVEVPAVHLDRWASLTGVAMDRLRNA
jgi:hypothetical protein